MRAFAWPLGSAGLPTLLVFFPFPIVPVLLYDCGPDCQFWRNNGWNMQDGYLPFWVQRIVRVVRPGIGFTSLRVALQFKYFDNTVPNCLPFKGLLDRNTFLCLGFAPSVIDKWERAGAKECNRSADNESYFQDSLEDLVYVP
jgi:hypothetical protein